MWVVGEKPKCLGKAKELAAETQCGFLMRKRQEPCGPWRSLGVLVSHRFTHLPNQPADAGSGSPPSLHPPAQPVMRLRVAPYSASVGSAGDRVTGLPRFPVLRL